MLLLCTRPAQFLSGSAIITPNSPFKTLLFHAGRPSIKPSTLPPPAGEAASHCFMRLAMHYETTRVTTKISSCCGANARPGRQLGPSLPPTGLLSPMLSSPMHSPPIVNGCMTDHAVRAATTRGYKLALLSHTNASSVISLGTPTTPVNAD